MTKYASRLISHNNPEFHSLEREMAVIYAGGAVVARFIGLFTIHLGQFPIVVELSR